MHSALHEYYKLRGMYNVSELGRMEGESSQNGLKVGDLKSEMDVALNSISHFLQSQMDGTTARRIAMEKVVLEETGQHMKDVMRKAGRKSEYYTSSQRTSTATSSSLSASGQALGPIIQGSRPPTAAIEVQ